MEGVRGRWNELGEDGRSEGKLEGVRGRWKE